MWIYAFLRYFHRKADQAKPFLEGISLSVLCLFRRAYTCTIAYYIPISKAVQASTHGIPK
jgi:hypothetical protein